MFQRILICTDFHDGLYRLVRCIQDLAIAGIRHIVFLHVVPFQEIGSIPRVDQAKVDQAQECLAKALGTIPEGVEVKIEVQSGPIVETIVRVSKTYDSQVIMLGTQSRTLLTEKLFGSTLVELSQRTTIPFFVVRPQLISTYREAELSLRCQSLFQYLLLPYDGSESAQYTLNQIKKYRQQQPESSVERCCLCWVVKEDGIRDIPQEHLVTEAQETLRSVQAELEGLGLSTTIQVRRGHPLNEVLKLAEIEDISAIALSCTNLRRLLDWAIPSFASELLRQSWHPVLFFPSK